jgi:IclR family KDG regulon transcriptional repressor
MNSSSGSRTVRRALALLDALARHPNGAGLSETARAAHLHHATAHRLLATLAEARLVELREGDGRYRLGLRILELAGVVSDGLELRAIARPTLLALSKATGETAHLATLDGDAMVFLDRVDGGPPVMLRTRVGFRAPVHVTAVGKAVLAWSTDAEVERVIAVRGLERHTEHTITDPTAFVRHLRQVRRQGFAVDNEEHRLTIRCVGVPIFDHRGEVVGAVSIAGPMFRLSGRRIREIADLVKSGARQISGALGCPDRLAPGSSSDDPDGTIARDGG